ncbi:tRNA pseudouridine synthase-like 1 isoform X2 [Hermetia illucens]|nr:tRNA pseudouridine synthase-like 1 isoform X2 [Hermetia illucens]
MQKTINKAEGIITDVRTVQGLLEIGLRKLNPVNEVEVVLSSRTDAGVHALQTSVHVDLENSHGVVYPTHSITSLLNRHFSREALQIRVINTIHVPNTFHSRYHAKGRTYLYRLAVAKQDLFSKGLDRTEGYVSFIPIEEFERCFFLQRSDFDVEAFKDAAQLFVGLHDFRTFMNENKRNLRQKRPRFTLRTIDSLTVEQGRSCSSGISARRAEKFYNYYDITISGRSFLHNQVRRMVGCLIGVATGKITKKDVYEMVTIPSKHMWNSKLSVAPPFGLYLCKVHYDEKDFQFPSEEEEKEDISSSN